MFKREMHDSSSLNALQIGVIGVDWNWRHIMNVLIKSVETSQVLWEVTQPVDWDLYRPQEDGISINPRKSAGPKGWLGWNGVWNRARRAMSPILSYEGKPAYNNV